MGCERVVEVGPSNTLAVMAKRTLGQPENRDRDEALGVRRDILTSETDTAALLFENGQVTPPPSPRINGFHTADAAAVDITSTKASTAQLSVEQSTPASATAAEQPLGMAPDAPVTAKDIVLVMVAQKLKKTREQLSEADTIKSLAGGRSTLENELVGDIENEFSGVPMAERPEAMTLGDLAASIAPHFRGTLGKKSTMLIEKIVLSKLPAGFSLSDARAYLQSRWGLAVGRQDTVLLSAVTTAPPARLTEISAAHGFFDKLAQEHLVAVGLPISSGTSSNSSGATTSIDPAALQALSQKQDDLIRRTLESYAAHLNIDLDSGAKSQEASKKEIEELQARLTLWEDEHGEDYAIGIKPLFDARKARHFASSWAWAVQQVLEVFYRLLRYESVADETLVAISRRADAGVLQVLTYISSLCEKKATNSPPHAAARETIDELLRQCNTANSSRWGVKESAKPTMSVSLKTKDSTDSWQRNEDATNLLCGAIKQLQDSSLRLDNRVILVTGAGAGSIGSRIVELLLAAGAKVIVTTSSYSTKTLHFFRDLYVEHSTPDSHLVVVPFNQASRQEVHNLVSWIYSRDGLGWDVDGILPFAALPEKGRQIDDIDSNSELAHRAMLTNIIRLIGAVKFAKQDAGHHHNPAQVILPLSANHGIFGGDGLYAESKIGLETLFYKWHSESWDGYLSIAGAAIGWTRGTGLMKANDRLAEEIERRLGIQTFSQAEMAANLVALLHPDLTETMEEQPIFADFNGGLDQVRDLSGAVRQIRHDLDDEAAAQAAIAAEDALCNPETQFSASRRPFNPRANLQIPYPRLPDYGRELEPLSGLRDMVDLDSVVVIAGYAELGPWGNARTRWEMEATGTFSREGWVEMAWLMGRIKYTGSGGEPAGSHIGWVDAASGAAVQDHEIQSKYGEFILNHAGIRIIEPELWDNYYDPANKETFQEIVIEGDLEPFEASEATAAALKQRHGNNVDIVDGKVRFKKGASILIPKATKVDTYVAGQLPTGFDPRAYGISEDIISQVDRSTLYALICTVEALFAAGITDPYEIYQYIHVSELGNCLGTGVGGVTSAARMYKGRSMEHDVAQDVLQETFLNTPAAWVNMLLLSSSGPIRTPVGACATALESIDTAADLIMTGKAKLCLVGGMDDLEEHMAHEFANMKATNNNKLDAASGRTPSEMSRPTASDRRGFVESHGAGIQIVCSAKVALDMGLPVYGILAFSGTSSDGVGRSVPAPGKGVMVNVAERPSPIASSMLSLDHRRRQLANRRRQIRQAQDSELALLTEEVAALRLDNPESVSREYESQRRAEIAAWAAQQESDALRALGTTFWRRLPEIAPIRGALAAWGLTADDLTVSSFHGTSTVKNELNECAILHRQLTRLGRAPGNRILGVFQKHLTGHPKGGAGAWMLNGCLQVCFFFLALSNHSTCTRDRHG
jgi:fatty acid synthase subunit alpha, fungi type